MEDNRFDGIKELHEFGQLSVETIAEIEDVFSLTCRKCESNDVKILGERGDDGYCETCTSPYARFAFKCRNCGNAIAVKMY